VVLLASDQPVIVLGAGSFLSELVELAGARNVFADVAAPSAPTSLEAIAARSPAAVGLVGGISVGFAAAPSGRSSGRPPGPDSLPHRISRQPPVSRGPAAARDLGRRLDALLTHRRRSISMTRFLCCSALAIVPCALPAQETRDTVSSRRSW
jgi:hypothetical protein